jgi:hypothetical protein
MGVLRHAADCFYWIVSNRWLAGVTFFVPFKYMPMGILLNHQEIQINTEGCDSVRFSNPLSIEIIANSIRIG